MHLGLGAHQVHHSTKSNNYKKEVTILVMSCWAVVWQNNSQCLLLNTLVNATGGIFQFVKNENTKNEHAGIKRKKTWRKSKRKKGEQF